MKPTYPIFILAKDDLSIRMISNSREELDWYEKSDIEEGNYIGWDANGYFLKISWDSLIGIKVELSNEIPQKDKLREAILNYVKRYRPKVSFIYSGTEDNMTELFKAAEEHIKAGSFRQKIKRLFGR